MATEFEKNKLVETLKGNKVFSFNIFVESFFLKAETFKKEFNSEWDNDTKKVYEKLLKKHTDYHKIANEFRQFAGVGWSDDEIQIVIIPNKK